MTSSFYLPPSSTSLLTLSKQHKTTHLSVEPTPPSSQSPMISTLPIWQQRAAFLTCFTSLSLSTYLLRPPLHSLFTFLPSSPFSVLWHPEGLGLIFILAGVSHFFVPEFEDIYPKKGSWGIWYLPGSPKFHVYWSGVAEILGGIGLTYGILYNEQVITSTFSALLLGLSVAVYPANFYMYTHGKELPKGVKMEESGHKGRFVAQIILCGVLAGLV